MFSTHILSQMRLLTLITLTFAAYLVCPYVVKAKSPAGGLFGAGIRHALPDSKERAKAVVEKLVAEDYEGIRREFNATMKASLSAEKMKEVWTGVIEHHGAFKSQDEPRLREQQGWEIVLIRGEMQRGAIEVEVDYDPEGKIGGLWVRPSQ